MHVSVFRFFSYVLIVSLLSAVSCKDKKGCTNPNAINYDSDAETEDGTCKAEGSIMFWINTQTFGYLYNDNAVQELNFYVNGELRGSQSVNTFFPTAPDCEDSFTFTAEVPYDGGQWVSYKVLDEDNNELWNGNIVVPAEQCNKLQLVYEP